MHLEIKIFLKKNKMTMQEFAEKLGYTLTHMSKVINKKVKPSAVMASLIEEETQGKITAETLLKG